MKETEITLVIPIKAQGKASVRTTRNNIAYIPKKTKDYMRVIEAYGYKIPAHIRQELLESRYYTADIECNIKPPASISKKKQEQLIDTPYHQKPDIDNIQKAIFDALTGAIIKDDKSVTGVVIKKKYNTKNQIIVTITGYREEE